MEEVNESIKRILSFLDIVQTSVNDYRQLLQQAHHKKYHIFVENWRKANKQKKQYQKPELKSDFGAVSKVPVEINQPANIAELEHADRLLEKARKIRKQVKVSEKPRESSTHLLDNKQNVNQITKKLSLQKGNDAKSASPKVNKDVQYNETSEYKISASFHTRSKSTAGHQKNRRVCVAKPLGQEKGQTSAHKSTERKTSCTTSKQKLSHHPHTVVVSKETFLSLKRLHIADATLSSPHLSVADRTAKNKVQHSLPCKDQQAGPSQVMLDQELLPTIKEFHKMFDGHQREPPFKLDKKWAWYTFLSSENEVHLSRIVRCDSYEDLKKASLLLNKIQETMFWIDLYNLVGKEMRPHLKKLDKNEKYTMLLIHHLKSIFSEDCSSSAMVLMC